MAQMGDWLSFHIFTNMITLNRPVLVEQTPFSLIAVTLLIDKNVLDVLTFHVKWD